MNRFYNNQKGLFIPVNVSSTPSPIDPQTTPKVIESFIDTQNKTPDVLDTTAKKDKYERLNQIDKRLESIVSKDELFDFINNKFSNLNESLINFKQHVAEDTHFEAEIVPKKKNNNYSLENITENMFQQLKSIYPDLPETAKTKIVFDGSKYYYKSKNKKYELTELVVLKIINNRI